MMQEQAAHKERLNQLKLDKEQRIFDVEQIKIDWEERERMAKQSPS